MPECYITERVYQPGVSLRRAQGTHRPLSKL